MPMLFLNQKAVREMLDMAEVIPAVEQAFKDCAQDRGNMHAKSYLSLNRGDFRVMLASTPLSGG